MSRVSIRDLGIRLGGRSVVAGVSTTVAPGEWLTVVGPNGAGKTTVLRAVAGLVAYQGSVQVDGQEVRAMARRRVAAAVALVPQQPLLPEDMRVLDYVVLGRLPHLGYFGVEGVEDLEAAHRSLERLDATALAARALGTLSGGEGQRVVLARALAQDAGVLLLDEPTTALDIGHAQQVLDLVERLRQGGIAVVAALHDLTFASQYADRLLLLDGGSAVAQGTAAEVLTESAIARFSGARVHLMRGPDGTPVVVPRR